MEENPAYLTFDTESRKRNRIVQLDPDVPVVSVSGGGMLLPWYFGALEAILEARRQERTIFAAFSSGAVASAIILCKLDPETVEILYAKLMEEERVSERVLGVAFVWGNITRKWLEEIMPENAAEMCERSLVVHVLEWRGIKSDPGQP